jgi:hypothetical protein
VTSRAHAAEYESHLTKTHLMAKRWSISACSSASIRSRPRSSSLSDALSITQLAAALLANREGENYRIPSDAVLIPVVVTPRLMYAAEAERVQTTADSGQSLTRLAELEGPHIPIRACRTSAARPAR